ncbi:MAG TPA: hypothetical protein VK837_00895 [Longimicrobiales bacterium]|nr:hypothetical protein [Longimicrobiales bacterium]
MDGSLHPAQQQVPAPTAPALASADAPSPGALTVIERLGGVHAAWMRIDGGVVGELVLAVDADADRERIRAGALEAIRSRGLRLDPARLRLAVLEPPDPAAAAAQGAWSRPLVRHDLQILRGDRRSTCRVQLLHAGDPVAAEATDLDTDAGRARAAARATLRAAETAYPGRSLGLEGLRVVHLGGRPHIALSVEAVSERRSARLSAVAPIDPSFEEAACLAALGAIERWLSA